MYMGGHQAEPGLHVITRAQPKSRRVLTPYEKQQHKMGAPADAWHPAEAGVSGTQPNKSSSPL